MEDITVSFEVRDISYTSTSHSVSRAVAVAVESFHLLTVFLLFWSFVLVHFGCHVHCFWPCEDSVWAPRICAMLHRWCSATPILHLRRCRMAVADLTAAAVQQLMSAQHIPRFTELMVHRDLTIMLLSLLSAVYHLTLLQPAVRLFLVKNTGGWTSKVERVFLPIYDHYEMDLVH